MPPLPGRQACSPPLAHAMRPSARVREAAASCGAAVGTKPRRGARARRSDRDASQVRLLCVPRSPPQVLAAVSCHATRAAAHQHATQVVLRTGGALMRTACRSTLLRCRSVGLAVQAVRQQELLALPVRRTGRRLQARRLPRGRANARGCARRQTAAQLAREATSVKPCPSRRGNVQTRVTRAHAAQAAREDRPHAAARARAAQGQSNARRVANSRAPEVRTRVRPSRTHSAFQLVLPWRFTYLD